LGPENCNTLRKLYPNSTVRSIPISQFATYSDERLLLVAGAVQYPEWQQRIGKAWSTVNIDEVVWNTG